jgi:putative nucleotidyltransferase with HDIG domain
VTAEDVLGLIPELELIDDGELRAKTVEVWLRACELAGVDRLEDALDLAPGLPDRELGVEHVRSVIRLAVETARTLRDVYDAPIDVDVVAAGAALHDACKVLEYAAAEPGTPRGRSLHHAISGAALALAAGLPVEVVHVVAYHSAHGVEKSLECQVVTALDEVSFDALARRSMGLTLHQFVTGAH